MAAQNKTTYKLKDPIQYGSETIEELSFRAAKAKDFRSFPMDMSTMTMGNILDLAAKLAGVAPSVIDELSGADLQGVSEIVGGFLDAGLEIGKTA